MTDGEMVRGIIEAAVAQGQAPGVVAAVARGGDVQIRAAGDMAVGGAPMREDTLAGRRVLRRPDRPLDDTVPAERPVTVRDLLTFTRGFGMQGAMFSGATTWPIVAAAGERELNTFGPPDPRTTPEPDTWLRRLGELPLLAQPGERWLYSAGAQVLGVLAARAGGGPFGEVMRERILEPLGMRDTGFWARDPARLAMAYEPRDGRLAVTDPPDGAWSRPPAFPDGAGGLVSTAADLLAFGRMPRRGGAGVLNPETVAEMTRDQLTDRQRARDLTVVVLTQRAAGETGMPAVCEEVLSWARSS